MASEDNFLRLDPYNFDTEEDYFRYLEEEKKERNDHGKRSDNKNTRNDIVGI